MKKIYYSSLVLNFIFIISVVFFVIHKGGFNYIEEKVGKKATLSDPLIQIKEEALTVTNTNHHDIVLLGDSHTDYFEWGEYFPNYSISNQGIAGDTVQNILLRLNNVDSVTPKKIFILMGINDLQAGSTVGEVKKNYQKVIAELEKNNPNAKIYVQDVFHVNNNKYPKYFGKDPIQLNKEVTELDKYIETLNSKDKNITYINNQSILHDNKEMPSDLTVDGLHLDKVGYGLWANNLKKYFNN